MFLQAVRFSENQVQVQVLKVQVQVLKVVFFHRMYKPKLPIF